jgi:hypothetical protein
MEAILKLVNRSGAIFIIFYFLGVFTQCYAEGINLNVCEQVSDEQLAAIYPKKLFPTEQERGCQWSNKPGGIPYFQIGIIEGNKNLREYFHKEIPPDFELKKIKDLGDRGLMTISEGYLAIIVIREGDWVLISTVNSLYIKQCSEKHEYLRNIYRGILQKLQ